jgi:hypothetical protein
MTRLTVTTVPLLLLMVASAGCNEDQTAPVPPPVLRIEVHTWGDDLDLDGYQVLVDGGAARPIALNSSQVFNDLEPGLHLVELAGVGPNCVTAPRDVQPVRLAEADTASVSFEVSCAVIGVRLHLATTGPDPDPSFVLLIDGVAQATPLSSTGVTEIGRLPPGVDRFQLAELAPNCTVAEPSVRTATLVAGTLTPLEFSVACVFDEGKVRQMAFTSNGRIQLARIDGSARRYVADGWQPAWSPDGRCLAYHCAQIGQICITEVEGGGTSVLATGDRYLFDLGSWSPDGTRLVFVSYNCDDYYGVGCVLNGLFTIRADGAGMTAIALPTDVTWVASPDWAPDGASIAFACAISYAPDGICVTAPNGEGFQLVSQSPGSSSRNASWSPDGSRIAFERWGTSGPELMILNADGTGVVTTGTRGQEPAWTRDGRRLLFTAWQCGASGCDQAGIASVNLDGTGRIQITTERDDYSPVARP